MTEPEPNYFYGPAERINAQCLLNHLVEKQKCGDGLSEKEVSLKLLLQEVLTTEKKRA